MVLDPFPLVRCACGPLATVHLCPTCAAHAPQAVSHAARIKAGLARARAQERHPGRPQAISAARLAAIRQALAGGMSKAQACRVFGVKRTTLYDALTRVAQLPRARGDHF